MICFLDRAVYPPETSVIMSGKADGATQETTQEKMIRLMKQTPSITRRDMAEQPGLSSDGIKYHLNKLKQAGRIRMWGPPRRATGRS
jgi:predicted HTH transcriptional regulator